MKSTANEILVIAERVMSVPRWLASAAPIAPPLKRKPLRGGRNGSANRHGVDRLGSLGSEHRCGVDLHVEAEVIRLRMMGKAKWDWNGGWLRGVDGNRETQWRGRSVRPFREDPETGKVTQAHHVTAPRRNACGRLSCVEAFVQPELDSELTVTAVGLAEPKVGTSFEKQDTHAK